LKSVDHICRWISLFRHESRAMRSMLKGSGLMLAACSADILPCIFPSLFLFPYVPDQEPG
jgi:hypothetical protein